MKNSILAITMGDPGGIGPEVILKACKLHQKKTKKPILLVGSREVFDFTKKKLGLRIPLHNTTRAELSELRAGNIYLWDIQMKAQTLFQKKTVSKRHLKFTIGQHSLQNACLTYASLEAATELVLGKEVEAIVTAPLNKTTVKLLKPAFIGHTEYLANRAKAKAYGMMFVGSKLKVTLVTIHIALKNVSKTLSKKAVLEKIQLTHDFLKNKFKIKKPRLGICALNPHGEETGTEENSIIKPAVAHARKKGIKAHGPFSADQLFYEAYSGGYDALISMYHDQGLAPFKMISFHDGVNVTLGLPFVRTSPDHGTAFDIAYKNKADEYSMLSSIQLAERLVD